MHPRRGSETWIPDLLKKNEKADIPTTSKYIETENNRAKSMKYSKKFNRDYEFYLRNRSTFTFSGDNCVHVPVNMEHGVSCKESFWSWDSSGKLLPTKEPSLLQSVIVCKKSINLHLKMWVEGYDEMMESVGFYMNLFEGEPPRWVEDSFRKQLRRKIVGNRRK